MAKFLKNRWYAATRSDEIGNKPFARTLLNEPVVFYRDTSNNVVALEDRCVHRQAPLSLGVVKGDCLECIYHGFLYEASGKCVCVPSQDAIPPGAAVRAYPIIEKQGFVFIWMGDPAKADTSLAYDFAFGEQPGWRQIYAQFHAKFDYRLLVDNLMDVTHIAFAHKTTIGAAGVANQGGMKTERDGEHIRISRWMFDIEPAPTHVQATGYEGNVDRWQIIEYTPPAFVWLKVGVAVAGSGAEDGNMEGVLLDRHSLHLMTPETDDTTHYFWTSTHDGARVNEQQEELIREQSIKAFNEDLVILEGQQKRRDDTIPTVDVTADTGMIQTRMLMERLLAADQ
jgi:vanillate O-demethylase monooxygenase subunit